MADIKIYKSLTQGMSNDKFKSEYGKGVIGYVSWERLRPYIENSIAKKLDEKIVGIKIDEEGIHVNLRKI